MRGQVNMLGSVFLIYIFPCPPPRLIFQPPYHNFYNNSNSKPIYLMSGPERVMSPVGSDPISVTPSFK